MFPRTLLILSCLALAACAEKTTPPVPHEVDFVSATLGQAAEQAHGELAMLARLRGQGMQPLLPPAAPSLAQPVSLAWTGEASGALKEICLQLGYRYKEVAQSGFLPVIGLRCTALSARHGHDALAHFHFASPSLYAAVPLVVAFPQTPVAGGVCLS